MKANLVLIALIVTMISVLGLMNSKHVVRAKTEHAIQKTAWFNADYRWGGFKRYVA